MFVGFHKLGAILSLKFGGMKNDINPYYQFNNEISMVCYVPLCKITRLWERWRSPEGKELESCSIIATDANEIMQPIHDRMPVILRPDDYQLWLDRNTQDTHMIEGLYSPYPENEMAYYEVPALVNNPRFDSPACIVKV